MLTLNEYCRKNFGEKLYKISLNGGFTCPNRDGTLDTRGCTFCSEGGSGEFAAALSLPVDKQIEDAKKLVAGKFKGSHYIAYFQPYTNTYAPVQDLRDLFLPVIRRDDISVLSIATRPDCLDRDVLDLLQELNRIKPVWIELGLQTSNETTATYIRRGYRNEIYEQAVKELNLIGIHVITHIIFGLPGETPEDMAESVRFAVNAGSGGFKLQLLHVLKGTDLARDYRNGLFQTLEFDEYLSILSRCLSLLPEDSVVHRLTGDGPKKLLITPMWSADKKRVINAVNQLLTSYHL